MTTLKTAKTTQPAKFAYPMLPYQKGKIDYGSLNFDPDVADVPPDHMEQNREIREVMNALSARFTDFDTRPDVFLDNDSNVCYNPDDLNVRAAPDVYIAFGVDAEAIRPRKLYLPWEVGKPPRLGPGSSLPDHRPARTPTANPPSTPKSASPNTGASTPPAAATTASPSTAAN